RGTTRGPLSASRWPAGVRRKREGTHDPLDLRQARAAALEAAEVKVPVPANFFLDATAAHFHGDTARGYAAGDYEVIAVLSCHFSYDRLRSIPNRWRSSPAGGPQGRGASPGCRIGPRVRFGRRTRSPRA